MVLDTRLIAFCGQREAGKSSIANEVALLLSAKRNVQVFQLSLADPIYLMVAAMQMPSMLRNANSFDNSCRLVDRLKKLLKSSEEGRRLLQTLGTQWGRDIIGKDCWINILAANIRELTQMATYRSPESILYFIIDDVRFADEAKFLYKEYQAFLFNIDNPPDQDTRNNKLYAEHKSELSVAKAKSAILKMPRSGIIFNDKENDSIVNLAHGVIHHVEAYV